MAFADEIIRDAAKACPTPFYFYDEGGIRTNARALLRAFAWAPFTNYFAVKATPNPHILRILAEEGCGADCSSFAELAIAQQAGLGGDRIAFTSNNTSAEEFREAVELGAVITLDDVGHVPFLAEHVGMPQVLCFRYNPDALLQGETVMGEAADSKFGMTAQQAIDGIRQAQELGVRRFGLHMMVATNERAPERFAQSAAVLFALARRVAEETGVEVEVVNLGGGIGIPYRAGETPADLGAIAAGIRQEYDALPWRPRLAMECGRFLTGPNAVIVSQVRHVKRSYKTYVGLDVSITDLIRIPMYGAHHRLSVLGKGDAPHDMLCDVTGSLCENADKFAADRLLPQMAPGDIVLIHDAGAHAQAMGLDYNGRLRSAELLLCTDGSIVMVRRAETLGDYLARVEWRPLLTAVGALPSRGPRA